MLLSMDMMFVKPYDLNVEVLISDILFLNNLFLQDVLSQDKLGLPTV